MVTPSAIATLILFIISIFFVIYPVNVPLDRIGLSGKRIHINLNTAPIFIIAVLWASQCIGASVIRDGIVGTDGVKPYNILILFFCLAYMAITLDASGVLRAAAFWVSNKGGSSGRKLYFYFYVMLTVLSIALGNDPIILSGTVFLVYYTEAMGLDKLPWLFAEFAAANTASMVLFIGNPTNVVICEGFRVNNVAFSAYTVLPFIACSISCFAALSFQFRSTTYMPRTLREKGMLDPRSVLNDPVSALVGSTLLGCCLAVMLVVSFFGVDVWKITLPFAVTKFIFDMAWDYWKSRNIETNAVEMDAVETDAVETDAVETDAVETDAVETDAVETDAVETDAVETDTVETDSDAASMRIQLYRAATVATVTSAGSPRLQSHGTFPLPPTTATSATRQSTIAADFSHTPPTRAKSSASKRSLKKRLKRRFPTFYKSLPRLPFALVPFAFSQFILIEGLAHQGWIDIFATWLVRATHRQVHPTIWVVGVMGVVLCNLAGTNIGATILLTKVMRAAAMPDHTSRAGAIALAVASNVGAVSFTFSASLAGLLWKSILLQKGVVIGQRSFAYWNLRPIVVVTCVGLAVVSAEMAVLY